MKETNSVVLSQELMECRDPEEIARKVKLAFRRMPGDVALVAFATAMTSALPHELKLAVWDTVRYSHIWWGVNDVLKGEVMENPIVQQAFGDAVPMRKWMVDRQCDGWMGVAMTLVDEIFFHRELTADFSDEDPDKVIRTLIYALTHFADKSTTDFFRVHFWKRPMLDAVANYRDWRGNGLLWYLTYRDDQNAEGGFACPCLEKMLLEAGVDPAQRNSIGLCWNDVARHVNRR